MDQSAEYLQRNINRLIQNYKIPIKTSESNEPLKEDVNSVDEETQESGFNSPLKNLDAAQNTSIREVKKSDLPNGSTLKRALSVNTEKKYDQAPKEIFGRDPSFPDALNELIQPLNCKLCEVKLGSTKVSYTHYDSKNHIKKAMKWLSDWSKETGEPIPKIPRLTKESGLTGADAYHCEACDLPLSSLQHANQHYTGKKHKMVVSSVSKPSGSGYYDSNGKWVRTPTNIKTDSRYGIGEAFRNPPDKDESELVEKIPESGKKEADSISTVYRATTVILNQMVHSTDPSYVNTQRLSPDNDSSANPKHSGNSYCKICDFSLVNETQLQQHLSGKRHLKNLKKLSNENNTSTKSSSKTPNDEVRPTPNDNENSKKDEAKSVQCIVCKISVTSQSQMEIHMQGSKHARKLKQLGQPPHAPPDDTVLASVQSSSDNDLSVYRTPSGNYYCKTCNFTLQDPSQFKQHISGKKHKKNLKNSTEGNNEKKDVK